MCACTSPPLNPGECALCIFQRRKSPMFLVLRISAGQPVSRVMTVSSIRTGEQNGGALLAFPCQGGFYLLLDLLTCH